MELQVVEGTEDEKGIDISNLRAKTGLVTLDPAFMNTASTESAVTFLDGEKGILRYRGIPIEELGERSTFTETAYLLIYGHLPTREEFTRWERLLTRHSMIHEDMRRFFDGYPMTAHPMAILSAMVSSLSSFYPYALNAKSDEYRDITIARLIAKLPTIAAFSYKKNIGHPFMYPRNDLEYCANFLRMMFAVPPEEYRPDPVAVKALNLLLILHADHEQNCSTSTVRLVGSAQTNLFASISAGICALWGPLHGGANQEVVEMLDDIRHKGLTAQQFIGQVKDKKTGIRLMGFGHRVYKNFDPRAKIIKKACDEVLEKLGVRDPMLDLAKQLEETALHDPYFVERKLYPNVDFYSGIIYKALGIPTQMFTVMFALGRLPGRSHQRRQYHDRGIDLEHASEHEQEHVQRQQELPLRMDVRLHPSEQPRRDLRVDQVAGHPQRDAEQDDDAADQRGGMNQHPGQIARQVHVAVEHELGDDRVGGSQRGRLDDGGETAGDGDDDQDRQPQVPFRVPESAQRFAPLESRPGRAVADAHPDAVSRHQRDHEQARKEAPDVEVIDRHARHHAVEDHGKGRREEKSEAARGGDEAEGEALGILLAHQRGQDDTAQRQDGDPARAGEGGEQRAHERGHDREPAGHPPEPALRRAHQAP